MSHNLRHSLIRAIAGDEELLAHGGPSVLSLLKKARKRGVSFLARTSTWVYVDETTSIESVVGQQDFRSELAAGTIVSPFELCAFAFHHDGTSFVAFCKAPDRHLVPCSIPLLFHTRQDHQWYWVPGRYDVHAHDDLKWAPLVPRINLDARVREKIAGLSRDVFYSIAAACWLLQTHRCQQVETPAAAAARRATARGPALGDEYRIIAASPTAQSRPDLGGNNASPRQHDRRAHLRHMPNGKIVSVRACVVGDPARGRITKGYSISGPTRPAREDVGY